MGQSPMRKLLVYRALPLHHESVSVSDGSGDINNLTKTVAKYEKSELPAPILDDIASPRGGEEGQAKLYDSDSQDSMKIAWRYQNLPKVQTYSSDPRR
ncbi:hypothetical protein JZ751_027115 [Albula glossodonta]|uniref:Uncharacterized protein n=1 Tax=Albula glossodonta TaxID=121402 RepID=A0A8T2NCH5_9TELE|nr:hypothetical protein JZ751_027115 [Albula glossodonta]